MCYSFIWYPQREIGLKGISSAVSSSHAQSAKQDHTSNRLKQHHSPVLLLICSKVVLSNPGSLYRLLLLQSVSQGVAAGGSHKIETREMDSWIFVVVMTLFIFGDVTARRNPLWNKEQSETQQLEAIETMLKNYQGEQLFFFLTPLFVVSWGIVNLFLIVFSSENSQTFKISKQ